MIQELDTIVLTKLIPKFDLQPGDVGTVVHVYKEQSAYEVEFMTGEGETIAVLTLLPADVRIVRSHEILHVRPLAV